MATRSTTAARRSTRAGYAYWTATSAPRLANRLVDHAPQSLGDRVRIRDRHGEARAGLGDDARGLGLLAQDEDRPSRRPGTRTASRSRRCAARPLGDHEEHVGGALEREHARALEPADEADDAREVGCGEQTLLVLGQPSLRRRPRDVSPRRGPRRSRYAALEQWLQRLPESDSRPVCTIERRSASSERVRARLLGGDVVRVEAVRDQLGVQAQPRADVLDDRARDADPRPPGSARAAPGGGRARAGPGAARARAAARTSSRRGARRSTGSLAAEAPDHEVDRLRRRGRQHAVERAGRD